ncbi:MAG TPA: TolC family protein [Caulobacteraceae bacterium]
MAPIRVAPAAALAAALAGCAVGPTYRSPLPAAPAQSAFQSAAVAVFAPEPPPGDWWRLYRDPALDRLVGQALAANTDLRVAAANLRQARAAVAEARASLLPTTTTSASVQRGRIEAAGPTIPPATGDTFDVGLDVSYEVDLFGKLRRTIEAARADAGSVKAAYDLARITVAAETARAYADACSANQQLAVARHSLELEQNSYDLTVRLLNAGRDTTLDTARVGALLEQTRATVPSLEAARSSALFRLAVLTGRPPAQFAPEAAACTAAPSLTTPIPVGDGAVLLRRRPDVRQAERTLAAATAQVGVATADLYPSVTLGGSVGSTAGSPHGLGQEPAFRWNVGPLIQWNFPNLSAAKARLGEARATAEAALASFDGTWLVALRDTETALTRYAKDLDRLADLGRARDQSARAQQAAEQRFRAGYAGSLDLLDAERTLADAEAAHAQAQAQVADDQINLFLDLGGGWESAGPGADASMRAPR